MDRLRVQKKIRKTEYSAWMSAVDEAVWRKAGVSVYDLPDCTYRDWFEAGWTPNQAARSALRRAGWGAIL